MTLWLILGAAAFLLLVVAGFLAWRRFRPRSLKTEYFQTEWQDLQKLLRNKDRWDVALVRADNLLDIALKKKRLRGRKMGERLVKAQRLFTDNDGVWFAHKLRSKVEGEPDFTLKKKELQNALLAIRQALKDLGALK